MAKSIAFAADASRLASLLLSYIPAVCAFVAPRQPGASTAIIDRLSHSRALSGQLGCSLSLLLALSLSSCRHDDRAPAPSASASAAEDEFSARARQQHFEQELARARARWQTDPGLGDCAKTLQERADLELCQAAVSALASIAAEPAATPELAIMRLAPGALALARLAERARYLSLAELAQRHVEGAADAGVTPVRGPHTHKEQGSAHPDQRALELSDGPVSQLTALTIRAERNVIRNLGAYLEYGSLPVRRAAFNAVKRLHAEHPRWALLEHLLQEATVLESDADLKRDLRQLSAKDPPQGGHPAQSAETK